MKRTSNVFKGVVAFVFVAVCFAGSVAHANDGGIAFGGSPKLLSGHPTVRMESELIQMNVGEKTVVVDCKFIFVNNGPACKVRMGFPDQGVGASDPDEENARDWKKSPPVTTFTSFQSWVNGGEVPTKLIRANEPGKFWHTKTVTFPANSRTVIRDLYHVPVGGGFVGSINGDAIPGDETSYIVHTGSSWKGTIGRTEIVVKFNRKGMSGPLIPVKGEPKVKFDKEPYVVYYTGISEPVVDGTTFRFIRKNWRPNEKDDLYLAFAKSKAEKTAEK